MLGSVEGLIKTVKITAERVVLSGKEMAIWDAITLACAAHSNLERVGGYAPVQWAYGSHGTATEDVSLSAGTDGEGLANAELLRLEAERT